MTRRELLAMAAVAGAARGQSTPDSIGAARDLVFQALELLSAHAAQDDVTRAMRFLRGALDQYASFGDAHYYRALCLKRLNQNPGLAKSDVEAAERYNSEALRERRDPFVLASPKLDDNLVRIGQKWALVVGISRFQPDVGGEPLGNAATDAEAFANFLKSPDAGRFPPNQVWLLKNEQATAAAIKARLNYIATRAKPEDIVVVYMSTHGTPREADIAGVAYLYAYDTNVTGRDQIFATGLAMIEVSNIITSRCTAQRTVVIFDTCHSGAGAATKSLSAGDVDRLRDGAGRYVLTSCEPNQNSYEDGSGGFFTTALIEQLRAQKGCVGLGEAFPQVRRIVSDRAQRIRHQPQQPVMTLSANAVSIVLGAAVGAPSNGCLA